MSNNAIAKIEPWSCYYGQTKERVMDEVPKLLPIFRKGKVKRILDLGCGAGGHAIYLAKQGFIVYGFDKSERAINLARNNAQGQELNLDFRIHDMLSPFPYENNFFDAVLCIRAMYHARLAQIKDVTKEISRVTRKNGYIYATGATKGQYPFLRSKGLRFKQIEPDTYISLNSKWKGTMRHFFNEKELRELFGNYEVKNVKFKKRLFSFFAQKKAES